VAMNNALYGRQGESQTLELIATVHALKGF
jgi:hypothetical protein